MRPRSLRRKVLVAGVPIVAVGALAWAVVVAHSFQHRVARNVSIEGHEIGGADRAELDRILDRVEDDLRIAPVRVTTTDGGLVVSGDEFGLTLDRPAVRAAAFAARRPAGTASRIAAYLGGFFSPRALAVPVHVSVADTARTLSANEGPTRRDPVDPQLKLRNGKFTTLPGSDGEGIDAEALAHAIGPALSSGRLPITIAANRVPLPSTFTTADLQALVDQATELTANPIRLRVGDVDVEINSAQLRQWVKPTIVNRHVLLTLDDKKTLAGVRKLVGPTVRKAENARLIVQGDGTVAAIAQVDGLECCEPDTVRRIQEAFTGARPQPVEIDLTVVKPCVTTDEVTTLKVQEPIGSFTTKHKAGEPRVINIHRIADLVRGQVILPGDTFSVNAFIGPRTPAKGFVEAHVIEDGVFKDSFGGGISQFATTLFHASFFAGLDIVAYKPHSLYISRYPYGREATLSYPYPDLKIRNNTPYGVMIWPTYTASTITVTLYSSPYVKGDVGTQTVETQDRCKVVTTTRERTYTDGRTTEDSFRAVYLPKEGVSCNGEPTAGATTTTVRPSATAPDTGAGGIDSASTTKAGSAQSSTPRVTEPPTREPRAATTAAPTPVTGSPTPATSPPASAAPTPASTPEATSPPTTAGGVIAARPPVTGVG